MLNRVVLGAAVVGVAAALPLLAVANHVDVSDPNDTRGLLDVRKVELSGAKRPAWKVITFSDWSVQRVFDRGYFLVRLDTFGSARYDYYALARSDGYRMMAMLVRDRQNKADFKVARLAAWRPTRTSVKIRVPLQKMRIGKRRFHYLWQVQTLFSNPACPRICIDDVPERRGVPEPIPGRRPLPTPTITITASPTPTITITATPSPADGP